MCSADIFNSDEYSKLMEVGVAYNQISIYKDIEQMVEYTK